MTEQQILTLMPAEKIADTLAYSRTMLAKLTPAQLVMAEAQIARAEKIAEWSKTGPIAYILACQLCTGKQCINLAIKQYAQ